MEAMHRPVAMRMKADTVALCLGGKRSPWRDRFTRAEERTQPVHEEWIGPSRSFDLFTVHQSFFCARQMSRSRTSREYSSGKHPPTLMPVRTRRRKNSQNRVTNMVQRLGA